jgi:hypothetical protein
MEVVIIDDDQPIQYDAAYGLAYKPTGQRCKHLSGDQVGQYSCALHDDSRYPETPCFAFAQIERSNTPCRLGVYFTKKSEAARCHE